HISLSSWLRDYLYLPLGGNRGSQLFVARNLLLTMLLGGLLPGAAWNFILWGAYHGVILVIYRFLAPEVGFEEPWSSPRAAAKSLAQMALMFLLTVVGWVLFRSQSLAQIGWFFSNLGFDRDRSTSVMLRTLLWCAGPLMAVQVTQYASRTLLIALKLPLALRVAALAGLIAGAMVFCVGGAK